MAVPRRFEQAYRARFDECGPDGRLRASSFLRYAQDLAWTHAESAGLGRSWYVARRLFWLIRAVELDLVDGVAYGTPVDVSTEVIGFRRASARRRSEYDRQGEERTVALAIIDWLLLNERGMPVRVPSDVSEAFGTEMGTGSDAGFSPLRVRLEPAPRDATARHFEVRRGDLDPMNHVNNAVYVDYVDDHLAATGHSSLLRRLPRRYRVEFVASAEPGSRLVDRAWEDDLGWSYRLEGADGRELVRARVETELATWVGG